MILRSGKTRLVAHSERLANELAAWLRGPLDDLTEPFLIENQVPQTHSIHAVVIWDAWKRLERSERSELITKAYELSGRSEGKTVTLAMGVTQREALDLGFLSYAIVSTRRENDKVSAAEIERAYAKAGGIVDKIGGSTIHRYPTREAAENAYRRLSTAIPGPYWAIVHEVGTVGDV
jgi:hypothetical protein